jgi:group II intron reverse transcriptase/maturase
MEGRGRHRAVAVGRRAEHTGEMNNLANGLTGIRYNVEKANRTDGRVQNLASHINVETLKAAHRRMNPKKAVGWDKVSKEDYAVNLEENLDSLTDRMKKGSYRPEPSRRVYIPKAGSDKGRPLGISCYEDKLVESVAADILNLVYDGKFSNASFGFRPKRSGHDAVREIIEMSQYRKTNYVVEADIKGFFDNVEHEWMMKFLRHDIADERFMETIGKFLKAGVIEDGQKQSTEKGTPQGNGASPILANIYLHYVLDLWFEKRVKKECGGEAYLIRYADDFVCLFQNKDDAERFYRELTERLAKFGLEAAEDKTRILEFGRFAKRNRERRGEGKPETFDFLGFTFYCGTDSAREFYRCRVKTSKKKFRAKLLAYKEWIKRNRNRPVSWLMAKLNKSLLGHYAYYGVTDNTRELKNFQNAVKWLLFKWLNRRSQRRSYNLGQFFDGLLKSCPMAEPSIRVSLFYNRWKPNVL